MSGIVVEARELRVRCGAQTVGDFSFEVPEGEVYALLGHAGSGKTLLLEALAGLRRLCGGAVRVRGIDPYAAREGLRIGTVWRDGGLFPGLTVFEIVAGRHRWTLDPLAADEVLALTGLEESAGTRFERLTAGERRRLDLALALLDRSDVLFLDEPTSGLDPATAADLMRLLRGLADSGTTVVITTHHPPDVLVCDRVAVLAGDGRLAFYGEPGEARERFQADRIEDIYLRLAEVEAHEWAGRFGAPPAPATGPAIGAFRQWALLTRRSLDLLTRNRLTLAVLLGSPLMVMAMFAVLFRPGAFSPGSPSPAATVMILFWIAFGGFFFGLTYGLLQICNELPVLRRERLTGLRVAPYVLAKAAVLLPLLAVVDALMLGVLRALDRLPAMGWSTYGELFVTLLLCSLAALALGLLVSAAVTDPAQATMALPMLCFPQVLFVGAILPVPVMAAPGRWLSYGMSNRWAFEGLGHSLGVERLWATGRSPLGPPLLDSYGDTFSRSPAVDWALLGGFTALFLAGACLVLTRRT